MAGIGGTFGTGIGGSGGSVSRGLGDGCDLRAEGATVTTLAGEVFFVPWGLALGSSRRAMRRIMTKATRRWQFANSPAPHPSVIGPIDSDSIVVCWAIVPIDVTCECGKKLRARDELGGRWVRCPACKNELLIPLPEPTEIDLVDHAPTVTMPAIPPAPAWRKPAAAAAPATRPDPVPQAEKSPAESSWRAYVFWILLFAMTPLVLLTTRDRESAASRFDRTIQNHPEVAEKLTRMERGGLASEESVFEILPGQRIEGALHSRRTWIHWLYALGAGVAYFGIVCVALPNFPAKPLNLLMAGVFTGTLGVILLLAIQVIGVPLFCCIGAWYLAAMSPSAPFGASLLGFFFGVGLWEELIKSLPVVWRLYKPQPFPWREACLWGMASGAGFGVSEGIFYSARMYNGIETGEIYIVRFISCVAFHTLLSGACAILLQRKQHLLHEGNGFIDWIINFMAIVTVPIFLHGLFNTLAKKQMELGSLAVAFASFAWLAWLIAQNRKRENVKPQAAPPGAVFERTAQGTRMIRPGGG